MVHLSNEDVAYIKSLNDLGNTPEQQRQRDEADAQWRAQHTAIEEAERNRYLSFLFSGAASGIGECSFAD